MVRPIRGRFGVIESDGERMTRMTGYAKSIDSTTLLGKEVYFTVDLYILKLEDHAPLYSGQCVGVFN